jgi:muramoyltetrapeptide carboxypeptidase
VLDNAGGIVFGEWIDIPRESETTDGSSRGGAYRSVADMIRRSFFPDADIPVAFGFPAGHGSLNYPLLLGEKVRLQVTSDDFTLEWID